MRYPNSTLARGLIRGCCRKNHLGLTLAMVILILSVTSAQTRTRSRGRTRRSRSRSRGDQVVGMGAIGFTMGSVSYTDPDIDYLFGNGSPIGLSIYGFHFPSFTGVYITAEADIQDEPQYDLATFHRSIYRAGSALAIPVSDGAVLFGGIGLTRAEVKITENVCGSWAQNDGYGLNLAGGLVIGVGPVGIDIRVVQDRVEVGNLEVGGTTFSLGINYVSWTTRRGRGKY